MKKLLLTAAISVIAITMLAVSCDSSSSSGGTADPDDLVGTWLATVDYEGEEKAILFEITATELKRVAFTETEVGLMQEEGTLGTYEVSGGDFVVSITQEWNGDNQQWEEAPSERTAPYSLDGTTLTMEFPEIGEIPFTKKNFVPHANLADTAWSYDSDLFIFHVNGDYTYESDEYPSTGTWEATEDLLRCITTEENGDDIYYEILYDYVIEDNELVLSWEGSSNEFTLVLAE